VLSVAVVVGTLIAAAGQVGRDTDWPPSRSSTSRTSPLRCRQILSRLRIYGPTPPFVSAHADRQKSASKRQRRNNGSEGCRLILVCAMMCEISLQDLQDLVVMGTDRIGEIRLGRASYPGRRVFSGRFLGHV
jgi:hypothetical protein